MRRSFGGGGGRGGGLRSVQRVLRPGAGAPPEPFSPSSANSTTINASNSRKPNQFTNPQTAPPNAALTLSNNNNNNNNNSNGSSAAAAFSTLINPPKSGAAATTWGSYSDGDDADTEWECVDAINHEDDQRALLLYDDFVFGTVPSTDEVNYAISALQQVFEPSSHAHTATQKLTGENEDNNIMEVFEQISSSSESGVDWIEPSLNIRGSRMLRTYGSSDRVYDAFHLLQTEPSVQRMVLSLSSDKAVWDAVLKNDVVKELRGSISQGDEQGGENSTDKASDDNDNPVKDILSWIIVNTKAKIMQLIDKITKLANETFQPANGENNEGDGVGNFQEKLKTSLFLSIVVLLIVVVTRAKSALP